VNLFDLNPLAMLRRRLSAVFEAFAVSACCCLSGALMAFVLAPGQAVQAYHLSHLPAMNANTVAAAKAGDELLVTGSVDGSVALPEGNLIAYAEDEWQVSVPSGTSTSSSPAGHWQAIKTVVPDLTLSLGDQRVPMLAASGAELSGPLHEVIVKSDSTLMANDEGQPLPNGTQRYRGLANGDQTTVWGQKAAGGGIIPKELFLGDRPAFETSQQQAASGLLIAGLCAMAASPLVLIGGLLGVILWRRQ